MSDDKPRRYEIIDAETGEKLEGLSFILTPTGRPLHPLTEPITAGSPDGQYVVGAYYTRPENITPRYHAALEDMMGYVLVSRLLKKMEPHHYKYLKRQLEKLIEREEESKVATEANTATS